MKMMMVAAAATLIGAGPALAQSYSPQGETAQGPWSDDRVNPGLREQPPGGAYQGYLESRDRPPEQMAEVPSTPAPSKHPGTLNKFNSNSGYGPEVQFDVDRRAAQQKSQR